MAWIESHESLPTHPKTKRLCRTLKIKPFEAVGRLHLLWYWAINHAQDGSLQRWRADDIADACAWGGDDDRTEDENDSNKKDAEAFVEALIDAGFIVRGNNGLELHEWMQYAGKLIAIRKKDAKRKEDDRKKKKEEAEIRDTSAGHPPDIQEQYDGQIMDVHDMSEGQQQESDGNLPESIRDLDLDLDHDLNIAAATTAHAESESINSNCKPETDNAFLQIESLYCELHNKLPATINSAEITIMQRVASKGIPLGTIKAVMTELVEKKKKREGARYRPPSSFGYYENAIVEAFEAQSARDNPLPQEESDGQSARNRSSPQRSGGFSKKPHIPAAWEQPSFEPRSETTPEDLEEARLLIAKLDGNGEAER